MLRQGFQDSILHPSPCTSGEDFAAFIGKVTVEGSALEVVPESMEPDGKTGCGQESSVALDLMVEQYPSPADRGVQGPWT